MLTSAGLGSGLDIDGLVSQLVNAESAPTLSRLGRQQAKYEADLSGLGQFSSALSSFQSALSALSNLNNFQNRTVSTNNDDFVKVSATSSAPIGDLDIAVENLAKVQKLQSVDFADSDEAVGSGQITIISGADIITVNLSAPDNKLTDLRDAINTEANGKGVQAVIVNVDDGVGGTVSRLQLTTTETGVSQSLSLFVDDSDGNDTDASGLSRFAYDPAGTQNMTQTQAAEDSIIHVDGQKITRSGNTIDDAIDGLSFDLVDEDLATVTRATVSLDEASAKAQVQTFTGAYNQLIDVINELSLVDENSQRIGLLQGDATVKGFERLLRENLFAQSSDTSSSLNMTQLGIDTDPETGHLSVDQERLDDIAEINIQDIGQFFAGDDGLAKRLSAVVDDFIGSDGSINRREQSIQNGIDDLNDQRDRLSVRLVGMEERLRRDFIAMDILVGQFNSVSNYLSQQLANLPGTKFEPNSK